MYFWWQVHKVEKNFFFVAFLSFASESYPIVQNELNKIKYYARFCEGTSLLTLFRK